MPLGRMSVNTHRAIIKNELAFEKPKTNFNRINLSQASVNSNFGGSNFGNKGSNFGSGGGNREIGNNESNFASGGGANGTKKSNF